jgi:ubiquinone/menaquinone biosynthesis C-methylase UbiE
MSETKNYIPALKYHWLTPFFDNFMQWGMPELKFKTALIKQAGIRPGQRVLDFGVGTATLSLLAKQLAPQSDFTGIDVDKKITAIAKQKVASGKANIHIDTYDGTRLPYEDSSFDRVISSLVFHHLTRIQKTKSLQDIRRVLAPGGELHIADWSKAETIVQRIEFLSVQLLDGFETTTDNVRGLLPSLIVDAGFTDVRQTETFSTLFGPLSLYRARR